MLIFYRVLLLAAFTIWLQGKLALAENCASMIDRSAFRVEQGNDLLDEIDRIASLCATYQASAMELLTIVQEQQISAAQGDDPLYKASYDANLAYLEYRESRYRFLMDLQNHADDLFRWQRTTIQLVTFFTLLIVSAGLFVAAREIPRTFGTSTKSQITTGSSADDDAAPLPRHEIVLQPGSVSVTTAAAWIVMMALGLGYFYLFTTEVMKLDRVDFGLPLDTSGEGAPNPAALGTGGRTEVPAAGAG